MRKEKRKEGNGMKAANRLIAVLSVICFLGISPALADDSFNLNRDGFSTSYTYTYDYWGDVLESPDAYRVSRVIDSVSLGLDALGGKRMKSPQSLFVRNSDLYVVDNGNNRILQIRFEGPNAELVRVISEIKGCDVNTFASPYDVYVDEEENIYVADYGHQRVVMMDRDLNWIKEFVKPSDATFDQNLDFLPKKIVVDVAGRLYANVTNVNKGLVKYEADGTFTGFIGANQVTVSMADYIWKKYFQTQEQRDASISFVPTEYENIYMDSDGFIYATTTTFSEYDLLWDNAKPIRRLNGLGNDILVKNDRYPPIGDLDWTEGDASGYGPSRMTDITVFDNDIYVVLDRTRGRLFGYDDQGVMLWAFGTRGNIEGAFTSVIALEHMGYDLIVLDQIENSITVFTPTEYGMKIYNAIETYQDGKYDESAEIWLDILKQNSNYPLAFRGIGCAILRQDRYGEAMEYFKMAHDRENYGRAFKLYRKEWIAQNLWWVALCLAVLILVPLALGVRKKMQWEVIMHEHNKVRKTIG